MVAASKPTSSLVCIIHILSTELLFRHLSCWSGLFPLDNEVLIPTVSLPRSICTVYSSLIRFGKRVCLALSVLCTPAHQHVTLHSKRSEKRTSSSRGLISLSSCPQPIRELSTFTCFSPSSTWFYPCFNLAKGRPPFGSSTDLLRPVRLLAATRAGRL